VICGFKTPATSALRCGQAYPNDLTARPFAPGLALETPPVIGELAPGKPRSTPPGPGMPSDDV